MQVISELRILAQEHEKSEVHARGSPAPEEWELDLEDLVLDSPAQADSSQPSARLGIFGPWLERGAGFDQSIDQFS